LVRPSKTFFRDFYTVRFIYFGVCFWKKGLFLSEHKAFKKKNKRKEKMSAYPGCWEETSDRDYQSCNYCRQENQSPLTRAHVTCDHHRKMKELEARRQLQGSSLVHIAPNSQGGQRNQEMRYKSLRALT